MGFAIAAALACVAGGCDVRVRDGGGVSVGLARGTATDEWTRTYALEPGARLEITNPSGSVDVLPAAGDELVVEVQREATAASDAAARQLLDETPVEESVTPERLTVATRQRAGSRNGRALLGRQSSVVARYTVRLPSGVPASFTTTAGAIRLTDVGGPIVASAVAGVVSGRGLTGPLDVSTIRGAIQLDMAAVVGDMTLVTVNGPIRLILPPTARATIDAVSQAGRVVIDERLALVPTQRDPQRLTATLNGGGAAIRLQTASGAIRISAR